MEWFYFDKMIPIHEEKLNIYNQFPVMMYVIREF